MMRKWLLALMLLTGPLAAPPVFAQVRTIDPNQPIDGDLAPGARPQYQAPQYQAPKTPAPSQPDMAQVDRPAAYADDSAPVTSAPRVTGPAAGAPPVPSNDTYKKDDLLAAGDRAFGKGAAGLGGLLESVLKDQGEPNAYIVGREGSGAIGIGLRYGSGTLSHKVEGEQPIYWTGPSLGFDLGGDAAKVFVLVYNLYDTEEAFKRFPGAEGRLYAVGGFSATYQRRGNIVLIPIRLGVGWRAGVNIGYTKYTHTSKWMPF